MGVAELNRVNYPGFDFDSHFDDIQARLQIKFADLFNDFALSSLGIMLIDVIAFGLDTLSFYMDRRATDLYLETARSRKSVARLTRQLGYKMRGSIAASTDLDVTINNPQPVTVPIPQGFQFQGPNDLIFEAAQEVSWSPAEQLAGVTKSVPVYQGETFTENFVSDGTANQVFELRRVPDDTFVVAGSVTVTVDGADWEETEFIEFEETDQFEVGYNDDPATVRFGDGTAGNIPTDTASIVVTYVASSGKEGKVSNNTIDEEVNPLVVAATTIDMTITNPQGATGGDDPEDLVHAKIYAGKVFKSRFVAVTRNDYEALAGSFADPLFGRVAVAQAISSRSSDTDLLLQTLVNNINAVIDPIQPSVSADLVDAEAYLTTADDLLSTIADTLTDVASASSDIDGYADTAITTARANKNLALEMGADATQIQTQVTNGKAAIDAIATGADQLTTGTKDALKEYFDSISAQAGSVSGSAASVEVGSGTILAQLGLIKDSALAIGTSVATPESLLLSAETDRAAVVAALSDPGVRAELASIQNTVDTLDSSVSENLEAIEIHFDKILSADCKANLVTVPILSKDAGGFYAAPSTSLINALQNFLDDKKEVTQTVSVVSGEDFLVPAIITIRVGVRTGFSESVTAAEVATAVDGILRDRSFGTNLYESDLNDVILLISGVSFVNVTINGHTDPVTSNLSVDKLDSSGNLIIDSSQVVTKGTVTITTEAETLTQG